MWRLKDTLYVVRLAESERMSSRLEISRRRPHVIAGGSQAASSARLGDARPDCGQVTPQGRRMSQRWLIFPPTAEGGGGKLLRVVRLVPECSLTVEAGVCFTPSPLYAREGWGEGGSLGVYCNGLSVGSPSP